MNLTRTTQHIAILLALSTPALASADVELSATEVRSYDLPADFNLGQAHLETTADGTTLLAATVGDPTNATCTVVIADDAQASAFEYQYEGGPTACVGVTLHPEGGFFVRGAKADAEEGDVFGFTARIGADGNEVWAVPDQELVDGSEGTFQGQYVEPHPELAYSAESKRLLGFTTGSLNIGADDIRLAQAHVIAGETGRLNESGKTFGTSGSAGFVAETTTRTSDGDFLLYIYDAGSQGAHFFTYDGRIDISAYKPLGEDWSQRFVKQMVYGPDDNVHLLWSPESDPAAPTNVTVVDDAANEVWSASWPSTVDAPDGGEPIELGRPLGMWVGAEYTLVLYATEEALLLRVADATTGDELGVAPLTGLTEYAPQTILNGADGTLKLLALNEAGDKAFELRLDVTVESEGSGEDAGGDAGLSDASEASDSGGGDEGCATRGPAAPAPVSTAVLAFLLIVFTIAHRTGFARQPKGDRSDG